MSRLSITFALTLCKLFKLQGVTPFRRPLPKIASFFSIDFKPQNFSKMCQNGLPVGRQIEPKIDKNRKNTVQKTHVKPTPQKTSKISDFGRVRDLPNRAETAARTPFSQIHLITKKCSKLTQKAPILEPLRTPKSQKVQKSDLQKNT